MSFDNGIKTIHFIRIPKTAGISIRGGLMGKNAVGGDDDGRYLISGENGYWELRTTHQKASDMTPDDFKFSFIRNPWDRLVSAYFFYIQHPNPPVESFEEFVKNGFIEGFHADGGEPGHLKPLIYWIDAEVDFIGRFENLQNDFNSLCDKLKLPHQTLKHENKSNHKPYWEYYDDETEAIIGEKYAKDIEKFGYKFK